MHVICDVMPVFEIQDGGQVLCTVSKFKAFSIVPDSITHIQKARQKNTILSAIFYIDFDTNRFFQI